MRNLELTKEELDAIRLGYKGSGTESTIYEATDCSLYKIFVPSFQSVLDNKQRKLELLSDLKIPFFKNPIQTLSFQQKFIGYELEYDKDDKIWRELDLSRKEKIMLLQTLKENLSYLSKKILFMGI